MSRHDARVLIVDDHPICVEALHMAATAAVSDLAIDFEHDAAGLRTRLSKAVYDALLVDLSLPDSEGGELVKWVREKYPDLSVIVVSSTQETSVILSLIATGIRGFIPKATPLGEMTKAIAAVLAGGAWYPDLAPFVEAEPAASRLGFARLSPAQKRVLAIAAQGFSNREIAGQLGLSVATIKSHLHAVNRVLDVSNRNEAILAFRAVQPG